MKERHMEIWHKNDLEYSINKFIFPLTHADVYKLLREKEKDTGASYHKSVLKLLAQLNESSACSKVLNEWHCWNMGLSLVMMEA